MGLSIPPLQPSPEEFKRRYDAGARTLRELDPEFCNWLERQNRQLRFQAICIGLGVGMLAGIVVVALLGR